MKCISHYHSPWEKTQGTDLQHVLSDFRALGVSLHQCRTSSSWGCISGGLLEKQRGHSETQPELQLSDQGALGGEQMGRGEEVNNSPCEMPNRGGAVYNEPEKASSVGHLCRRPSLRGKNIWLDGAESICQRSPGCSKKGSLN